MITVSQDYKDALAADNRNFYCVADITLWNGTTLSVDNTNIWQGGFQIKQAVSGQSTFEVGACVINELKLVLNNIGGAYDSYDFYGAEITASFGLYDSDGTLIDMDGNGNTTIQKGIYYVDEVESNGTLITLTCLDAMVKFDRNFSDVSITYPSTLQNIVQKICQKCGVPYSMVAFHNSTYSVAAAPDDTTLTCRDVLTMVCQIACAYGTIDRFGEFTIDWFDTDFMQTVVPVDGDLDGGSFWVNVDSADGGSFWDLSDPHDSGTYVQQTTPDYALSGFFKFNRDHSDVRISGVKLTQNSATYLAGSDRYIVEIQSNALINAGDEATILSDIASRIIGCGMRAFSANHLADPTLEAGDTVTLTDHLGNTYRSVVTDTEFSAGEQQRTDCDAESYVSNQSIRYTSASKEVTDYNVRAQAATGLLANAYGMYQSETVDPQTGTGAVVAVHDAATLDNSTFVIIKNENGLQRGTRNTSSDSWSWENTTASEADALTKTLNVAEIWLRNTSNFPKLHILNTDDPRQFTHFGCDNWELSWALPAPDATGNDEYHFNIQSGKMSSHPAEGSERFHIDLRTGAMYSLSGIETSADIYSELGIMSPGVYSTTTSGGSYVRVESDGTFKRYVSSSLRYKHDITANLDENPDKLYDLAVKQFKYNKNYLGETDQRNDKDVIGFIAEEVAEVMPGAVDYDDDGRPEMWNVHVIVPAMLKLIQEQKKQIDALEERVKALEERSK